MTSSAMPFGNGMGRSGDSYAARRTASERSDATVGRQRLAEELTRLPRDVNAAVVDYMDEHGITRAALAARMGVSPGRVSQVLCGGENLTLRTLASVAAALNARFEVTLTPDNDDQVADAVNALPPRAAAHLRESAKVASQ